MAVEGGTKGKNDMRARDKTRSTLGDDMIVNSATNLSGWSGIWHVPPAFMDMGFACCQEISKFLKPLTLPSGEFLFYEGEKGSSMYFVNEGKISVRVQGKQVVVLEKGAYLGELGLMLQEGRKADAFSLEECLLLELERNDFYEILEKYSVLASKLYENMSDEVRSHIKKTADEAVSEQMAMAVEMFKERTSSSELQQSPVHSPSRGLSRTGSGAKSFKSFLRAKSNPGSFHAGVQYALTFMQAISQSPNSPVHQDFDMGPMRVGKDNARPGLLVTLDLDSYLASGQCRFPGDDGPGTLLEDHFGDSSMWRVRWLHTNTWGIYHTGYHNEFHLLVGGESASKNFDSACFMQEKRLPSLFFCSPLASTPADRKAIYDTSSPRSRIFLPAP